MKNPKEYIVFPLDVPDRDEALRYVTLLKGHVGLFKVGLELFISQGPDILKSINEIAGNRIFLDLKLHDIPATVIRAFRAACRYSPKFVTIHCDQGEGVLKAAAQEGSGKTEILAVTILTSLNAEGLLRLGYDPKYAGNIEALVLLRAETAKKAGCRGVVCSGHEAAMIKERLGKDLIAVVPGIRPSWAVTEGDDQRRIVTPGKAVLEGADYIVVGRPIRNAKDPADAAKRVAEEIASAQT